MLKTIHSVENWLQTMNQGRLNDPVMVEIEWSVRQSNKNIIAIIMNKHMCIYDYKVFEIGKSLKLDGCFICKALMFDRDLALKLTLWKS
jgi:hypothetical protein